MVGMAMDRILMKDRPEKYEEWLADANNSSAVKAACVIKDYDPTGEVTAALISDWFFDYRIGWKDPERFKRYLTRNITTYLPQYKELLRTQPGVGVELDYLISDYRERELKSKGTTNSTQTHGKDITNASKNGGSDSTTRYGSGTSNIRTGGMTSTRTGNDTTERTENGSDIHSGKISETDVQGKIKEVNSPHVKKETKTDNDHSEWAGNEQLQANNPMSKKYSKFIGVDPNSNDKQYYQKAFQHMPAGGLDWTTATAQAQDGHRGYNTDDNTVTESYIYGDGVEGDIRTTEGDKANPSTKLTEYQGEKHENESTGNDKTTYNTTDGVVYDNITDQGNHTGSDETVNTNNEKSESTTTYGNIENVADTNNTDREVAKGRSSAPQELIMKAKSCIIGSNAWLWLREQLEPCFDPCMED